MGRKQRAVRRHTAHVMLPSLGLPLAKANAGMELILRVDKKKIGHLVLGRGSVTWYGRKWKNGRAWSWSDFAKHMEES